MNKYGWVLRFPDDTGGGTADDKTDPEKTDDDANQDDGTNTDETKTVPLTALQEERAKSKRLRLELNALKKNQTPKEPEPKDNGKKDGDDSAKRINELETQLAEQATKLARSERESKARKTLTKAGVNPTMIGSAVADFLMSNEGEQADDFKDLTTEFLESRSYFVPVKDDTSDTGKTEPVAAGPGSKQGTVAVSGSELQKQLDALAEKRKENPNDFALQQQYSKLREQMRTAKK